MGDGQNAYPKEHKKLKFFFLLILGGVITIFLLATLNYCLNAFVMDYLEEDDPDHDLSGMSEFMFSNKEDYRYEPDMSNLGTTGKLYFDCYIGECVYQIEDPYCENKIPKCFNYEKKVNYACSSECRTSSCSRCECFEISKDYVSSVCLRETDLTEYNSDYNCYADNLVLFWKKLRFIKYRNSKYKKYTYLNSAVPHNQPCPEGKRMCGYLDNLNNKLCLPTTENCPINYISLHKPKEGYNYESVTYFNKTIYYSNELTENGRIAGGLFVDR